MFNSKGHGVYYADGPPARAELVEAPEPVEGPERREGSSHPAGPFLAVTGPQRAKLRGSALDPYFAVPHGDMMVSGCFGLLWAFAEKHPQHSDEILETLGISAALVA